MVGLEATYAEAALISEIEIGVYPNLFSTNLGYAQLIHDARSYWLPAGSESVVLRSSPPPEVDICLPAPSCAVWFAQPVRVPPDMIPNTDMLIVDAIDHNRRMRRSDPGANAWREMLLPNGHVHRHMRQPGADYLDVSVMADLTNMRANLLHLSSYIEGVLLLADESSRPVPEFGWLVRHHKDWEGQVVSHRSIVPARSDRAAWGHLVRLLSGVIAFGEWVLAEQSEPMPPPNAPRRQRRRWERDIRRGVKRENERAGGLAQIHILRTQRPAQADGPADADVDRPQSTSGERASPIAHFRVGYFRRQHLGPRAEGRTEVRWIYPTVVNPENAPDEPRVYVLPRIE